MRRFVLWLLIVVSILISFFLGRKSVAQSNNTNLTQVGTLEYLEQYRLGILYENPIAEQIAYENWQEQAKKTVVKVRAKSVGIYCSCVAYLYEKYRDKRIKGYGLAKNIPIYSTEPYTTGYGISYESSAGHVFFYKLTEEGKIQVIDESNYIKCTPSSGRIINPKVIKGFIPI